MMIMMMAARGLLVAVSLFGSASALSGGAPKTKVAVEAVQACLRREYANFFAPLEPEFYEASVSFEDPLASLAGLEKYRGNVDMLAGRTVMGGLLFSDASIRLHSCEETGTDAVRTRWMLQMTFKALPWRPTARFTGVSEYTLDAATGKVLKQRDFWDSIDLGANGAYARSSKIDGLGDFAAELALNKPAPPSSRFELLRRARDYTVRRIGPKTVAVAPIRSTATEANVARDLDRRLRADGLTPAPAHSAIDGECHIELRPPHPWDRY